MDAVLLREMFNEFKLVTLSQVSLEYKCSIRTVQRQFVELAVLRSYNKNSRFYTLPGIPKFNIHGIWEYQGILFSQFGDLRKTVKHLILNSESGLNGGEIGDIVNLLPRSFMYHFREMKGIFREKVGGVYVYFSNDPSKHVQQSRKRDQISDIQKISDAIAIKLLIAYIKHPELSIRELSDTLACDNSCHISSARITNFLLFHDLLKKKPDSRL